MKQHVEKAKHHLRKVFNFDYLLPIIFAIAIGTGILIGIAIDIKWLGTIVGIFLGAIVLLVFYRNKNKGR